MVRRLPNGGKTEVGQRGSGHLAVSLVSGVAGLIKPAQCPCWQGDEAVGKPGKDGAYTNQRLTSPPWEGPRKKAEVSNRTREIRPFGIIGGPREPWRRWHMGTSRTGKVENGNPPHYRKRARVLSQCCQPRLEMSPFLSH